MFMWKLFFLFFFAMAGLLQAKTVYFVPYPGNDYKITFFEPYTADEFSKKWIDLRKELEQSGYQVKFTQDGHDLEDFTALISITNMNPTLLNNLSYYSLKRCWLYIFEPPVYTQKIYNPMLTHVFGKIYVLFDDLVDNLNYFKFYYPQPRQERINKSPSFAEKKLCVLISRNKKSSHPNELYTERQKIIKFFSELETDEFDLYGKGWVGHKKWKGEIENKWDVLKNYKFSICYENMKNQKGYITEKIFDAFVAGSVPIYLGASNLSDYIPKECYIDREQFVSEEDLYHFLKAMDEETYQKYIDAIDAYFKSPQAKLFSIELFIQTIKENLASLEKE